MAHADTVYSNINTHIQQDMHGSFSVILTCINSDEYKRELERKEARLRRGSRVYKGDIMW